MLVERPVKEFVEVLASAAPAPGGGSASALAGAMGAGLGAMVAGLSLGRKKYAEYAELLGETARALAPLVDGLTLDVDRDTRAFDGVTEALKLPKDTQEERALRQERMAAALLAATRSPLGILGKCADALERLEGLVGRSNATAASDLGTGAALLRGAAQGAWLNILINLRSLGEIPERESLLLEARGLYARALRKADAAFQAIEATCTPEG